MDIFNSDWLIHMIEKSATTPQARLVKFFEILDDWLNAPQINAQINFNIDNKSNKLQHYLSLEAAKAGAATPEILANQLYFMSLAAAQEKINGNNNSLNHAKSAAKALIDAQTKRDFHFSKKAVYASAASFIVISMLAGSILWINNHGPSDLSAKIVSNETKSPTILPSVAIVNASKPAAIASPEQTAALFARIDQMKKGSCQLIEAIQLPDAYKKVYFENVVMGQISTNPEEQRLANELLNMVRCNYTPMLMANSKN